MLPLINVRRHPAESFGPHASGVAEEHAVKYPATTALLAYLDALDLVSVVPADSPHKSAVWRLVDTTMLASLDHPEVWQ